MEALGASKVEVLGLIFLCFFFDSVLLVAALAGVSMGTTATAVAKMASVKSRIANLLMRLSRCGWAILCGGLSDVTPRRNKHSRDRRTNL